MAMSNIRQLDDLLSGAGIPLGSGADPEAIGALQDLLYGHGFPYMPGLASDARGSFGPRTRNAVAGFRREHSLPAGEKVDRPTLQKLIDVSARRPLASQAYLTLALDKTYTANLKLVSIVTRLRGAGRLAETRPNFDKSGLGFGLLPWSQRSGRLDDLLKAYNDHRRADATACFGGPSQFDELFAYANKADGGIDANGASNDSNFKLLSDLWLERFRKAGRNRPLQNEQVEAAKRHLAKTHHDTIAAKMPLLVSERAVAFAFDLILQFQPDGAKSLYDAAVGGGTAEESVLLIRLTDAATDKLAVDFPDYPEVVDASRDRRMFLMKTSLLSDGPFVPDGGTTPSPSAFPKSRVASYFLHPRQSQALLPPVSGTNAEGFIGGTAGLPKMGAAIGNADSTTNGTEDFIYMINWHCDHTMNLVFPDTPAVTLEGLLTQAAQKRVQIRAIFWRGPTIFEKSNEWFSPKADVSNPLLAEGMQLAESIDRMVGNHAPEYEINQKTADFLNGLHVNDPNNDVHAIRDGERGLFGTHHQKLLVVRANNVLTAFVGGIEYNSDRNTSNFENGAPLFDTTVRLDDKAAWLALQTFLDRWKSHPENAGSAAGLFGATMAQPASTGGTLTVQFTHTYGRGYSPRNKNPIWTASDALANGILNAKTYFYIEDQYFVGNPKLITAIRQALRRNSNLCGIAVIASEVCVTDFDRSVTSPTSLPTPPPDNVVGYRRRAFVTALFDEFPGRFLIFERQGINNGTIGPKGNEAYIHSKLVFVDDEAMFIGSVNANHRSWYHDSEVDATIVDAIGPGSTDLSGRGWVRKFRCQVWERHFGSPCDGDPAKDLLRWRKIFSNPGSGGSSCRVVGYDVHPTASVTKHPNEVSWEQCYDPS